MKRKIISNLIACFVIGLIFIIPINVKGDQQNYTIRYFKECGDAEPISTTDAVADGWAYPPIEAGTKEGYNFNGWYECNNPENYFFSGQNIHLKNNDGDYYDLGAIWGRAIYTHIENDWEGWENLYYHIPFQMPEVTKGDGYTFLGWYTDSNYNNKITAIEADDLTITDIYGKFIAHKYTIKYDSNGGTGTMEDTPCTYGEYCHIRANTFTKNGYEFDNWNTRSDGKGKTYNVNGTVYNLTTTDNDVRFLYAMYHPIEYGITFNLNGGENNVNNPFKYTIEEEVTLYNPTRDNYSFAGWYSDSAFTNKVTTIPKGSTGLKTLYAKWVAVDYTITYILNGGEANNNPSEYGVDEPNIILNSPIRKGYVFGGWYSDSAFTNKVTTIPTGSSGNKILYAQWVKSSYKINYKANGASGKMSATTCKANANCTLRGNSFKRTGYTFVGWNTNSSGTGISYTNKQVVKNITSGSSITLYAIWKPIVYKIAFIGNGSTSGTMQTIECTYGKNCQLPVNNFTRLGYKYNGWNTKSNGKGKNYKNNQTVKNLASSSKTVNLYAKWSKIKYSIKYNLNGGKNNKKNPSSYYVTTSTISFKNPTRSGYGFLGWYTDKEFTNKVTSIPKGSTGNVVLYAKWIKTDYKVTFKANGASGKMKTITCKINKNCTLTKNSFSRKGYSFKEWNTKADGTGTSYSNKGAININVATNTTLYAIWQLTKYSITYKLNGGVNNVDNPSYYTYANSVSLKTPTRDGYGFAGWYTDSKFKKKATGISKGSTGTKTFYAKWTQVVIAVDRTDVVMDYNSTEAIWVTFNKKGTIYFNIDDPSIVTGSWDDGWYGSKTILYLESHKAGSTKVTITNSVDKSKIVINVRVKDPWDDVELELPSSIGDYSEPKNRMSIIDMDVEDTYIDSYLVSVRMKMIKYDNTNATTFAYDVEFYDKYGALIDTGFIYVHPLALNREFVDEILVPAKTAKIVFPANALPSEPVFTRLDYTNSSKEWTMDDIETVSGYLNAAMQYAYDAIESIKSSYPKNDNYVSYFEDAKLSIGDALSYLNKAKNIVNYRIGLVSSEGESLSKLIQDAMDYYNGYNTFDTSNYSDTRVGLGRIANNGFSACTKAQALMLSFFDMVNRYL